MGHMFIWTFLLRITNTIISQSTADYSWITLRVAEDSNVMQFSDIRCKRMIFTGTLWASRYSQEGNCVLNQFSIWNLLLYRHIPPRHLARYFDSNPYFRITWHQCQAANQSHNISWFSPVTKLASCYLLQLLQFNGGSVLKELLTLLLTPPNIPRCCRNVCSRMLEDFHKFGSSGCSNLPEAEVLPEVGNTIHTVTLAHVTNNFVIYTAEKVRGRQTGDWRSIQPLIYQAYLVNVFYQAGVLEGPHVFFFVISQL
jgi:hypothetical protein